ncbi:MAG: hypothetical protein NZ930_01180 [Candidatus Bipolaricaulota bacterium]|nr:hypothetical protein [Candidatus Bipolaricaulota bacterium]MDW8031315.1 hypothetical protein [Candidatus Bipolaricaulota bacterium]
MRFSPRALLAFLGRFFTLLVIFSLIWYWLALFYAGLLVSIGNGTLNALGYPPMLQLKNREIILTIFAQKVQVSTGISSLYGVHSCSRSYGPRRGCRAPSAGG